jgi:hypothetical protein
MTIEEALGELELLTTKKRFKLTPGEASALDMVIKTLEQDVLDKIRAEIEEQVLESLSDGGDDWFAAEKVNECLEIIDKYKTESEG